MFKFDLGAEVKDKITGFSGVIMGRYEYLTGCRRYGLQAKKLKDGKPQEWQVFDEDQLILVKDVKKEKVKNPGGPMPNPKYY